MNLEKKNIVEVNYLKDSLEIGNLTELSLVRKAQKDSGTIEENNINNNNQSKFENIENQTLSKWKLEIPKIGLVANIAEGTSAKILDVYIGHFEETQKKDGNIGLAAHNRGYRVNYFNRLKELEIGDEIFYTYLGETKEYFVNKKLIIQDTNWQVLENTENNQLTLITCVENEPNLRRCVQAIPKDNF